jgi:hypothetical protein
MPAVSLNIIFYPSPIPLGSRETFNLGCGGCNTHQRCDIWLVSSSNLDFSIKEQSIANKKPKDRGDIVFTV